VTGDPTYRAQVGGLGLIDGGFESMSVADFAASAALVGGTWNDEGPVHANRAPSRFVVGDADQKA
jgi:hypothetical protein